jgi:hypothetical protein
MAIGTARGGIASPAVVRPGALTAGPHAQFNPSSKLPASETQTARWFERRWRAITM